MEFSWHGFGSYQSYSEALSDAKTAILGNDRQFATEDQRNAFDDLVELFAPIPAATRTTTELPPQSEIKLLPAVAATPNR